MNKFTVAPIECLAELNEDYPVLYKILIGNRYYLHKGKLLMESLDRFLDDVFRGCRNKKFPEQYSEFVAYCNKYPSAHRIGIEIVFNGDPAKLMSMEDKMYKALKNDPETLNRADIPPYKPEWMMKAKFQDRCEVCIKSGVVDGKKTKFTFCPKCGKLNK